MTIKGAGQEGDTMKPTSGALSFSFVLSVVLCCVATSEVLICVLTPNPELARD
jgi:hypothetical protein